MLATQLHRIFEAAEIPYYITGGVAATSYGDPRTTRDVDVVLNIPRAAVAELQITLGQAGFYVAGSEDVMSGRMKTLQVTQIETISRADLMIADDTPYAKQQFSRRRRYAFPNQVEVYLSAPKDLVISKLRWEMRSSSEKQQRDVLAILKVQQQALDYPYMYNWAEHFQLSQPLAALITAAGVRDIAHHQWEASLYSIAVQAFSDVRAAGKATRSQTGDISA